MKRPTREPIAEIITLAERNAVVGMIYDGRTDASIAVAISAGRRHGAARVTVKQISEIRFEWEGV